MGNGATMDYRFGSKNVWRRWAWNQARHRLKALNKKPAKSTALYLPGAKDLDRPIAKQKGFKEKNLYAAEIDKKTIKALRKKGVNVINGDIDSVVGSCKASNLKLDVIILDYCGGLNPSAQSLSLNLWANRHQGFDGGVIVANFLRGRDRAAELHSIRSDNGLTEALLDRWHAPPGMNPSKFKIHRGYIFFEGFSLTGIFFDLVLTGEFFELDEGCVDEIRDLFIKRKEHYALLVWLLSPNFYSYKSNSGQFFDSVAFTFPPYEILQSLIFDGLPGHRPLSWEGVKAAHKKHAIRKEEQRSVNRKIAAAKAIRTMRIKKAH